MFENSLDSAAQVEELDVRIKPDTLFNRRTAFYILPNVRAMRMSQKRRAVFPNYRHFKTPIDFAPFKIKTRNSLRHWSMRLETLSLDFSTIPDTPTILFQLKDLPVLKKLSLHSPRMSIQALEQIHKNISPIQDFALKYIHVTESNIPSDIIHATSITKIELHLGMLESVETHAQFYQYLTLKYINITDTKYADQDLLHYDVSERQYIYLNEMADSFKVNGWR
ncbi:hypothetical protein K501DRAFT_279867 [Backusella circina FSU 941]|nr:hypothetical protein K501DRAFT_279867 [Backusella circina FSU 941]